MTQKEIIEYNKRCAEFLGYELITPQMRKNPEKWKDYSYWEHKDKANVHSSEKVLGSEKSLSFHSDWNWIMKVVNEILKQGYRKYTQSHEEYSRCVFTDMAISYQTHDFGGGNIVADSGNCNTEKEAVVNTINQFLIHYYETK